MEWGLACPGLTWVASRLCVCEDPRLRPRRRRVPPLGELRVPLRKLVANRARSFSVCLEKRRLVSRGGAQGGALGSSNRVLGELESGGAGRETWAVSGQGDEALLFQTKRPESLDTSRGMSLYEVRRTVELSRREGDRPGVLGHQAGVRWAWRN